MQDLLEDRAERRLHSVGNCMEVHWGSSIVWDRRNGNARICCHAYEEEARAYFRPDDQDVHQSANFKAWLDAITAAATGGVNAPTPGIAV